MCTYTHLNAAQNKALSQYCFYYEINTADSFSWVKIKVFLSQIKCCVFKKKLIPQTQILLELLQILKKTSSPSPHGGLLFQCPAQVCF